MAPWNNKVSPAATQEPDSTSSDVTSPILSLIFNQPNPNELLTLNPSALVNGVGESPSVPVLSVHLVVKRTLSWSGKFDVTKNFQ